MTQVYRQTTPEKCIHKLELSLECSTSCLPNYSRVHMSPLKTYKKSFVEMVVAILLMNAPFMTLIVTLLKEEFLFSWTHGE